MSEAILQATIRAYDEFTQQFEKLQQELVKTEQVEQRVAATTEEVNAAMAGLVQAKTKAREATEKYNKVIAEMSLGGKQGAEASAKLAVALNEVVAAERLVEQETIKLNKTLGGYNLTSKEAQAAIKQVDRALDDLSRQHQQHSQHANNDMMQTMAMVTAFYSLVRAMQGVVQTGREFELSIKQSQAVTGDMTSTLRDFAMAARDSIYAPKEMAGAFYSLGSAGLSANETLMATPAILDFATAGLIGVDNAAYATISTIKAFRLEWEQAAEVTDAFTEAMNTTTLNAPDFQWVMSSAGAVGKLAAQDFREVVAAAAAMKDAGVQAQDAGTSIKAALLALMSPASEAQTIIKDLGINIYDASGQMKQWHEIVAEFERVLAPYNDEARNMILTTILGTDGIRAMATSLNMGSDTLLSYVEGMRNADGATQAMADTMADTFDGALRKANGNLERTKILLFEDLAPAAASALGAINDLVLGFNSMDESERRVIEGIVGAAGLIVAIKALIGTAQMLGITLATVTGPIGLLVMGTTALVGAGLIYKGQQESIIEQEKKRWQTVSTLTGQYDDLTQQLSTTQEGTEEYKRVSDELNKVIEHIGEIMPDVVTAWDDEHKAVDISTESLNANLQARQRLAIQVANDDVVKARQELEDLKSKGLTVDDYFEQNSKSMAFVESYTAFNGPGLKKAEEEAKKLSQTDEGQKILAQKIAEAERNLIEKRKVLEEALKPIVAPYESEDIVRDRPKPSGKNPYIPPDTGGGKNKALEAAKAYIDAVTAALRPYEEATTSASSAVAILGAKEQYLSQIMQSGQGTVYQAVELNKVRTEQMSALAEQQDVLTAKTEAEAKQLADVRDQYSKATDPEAARALQQEIDKLTGNIYQYGQTWWQIEQQKQNLTRQAAQEEKKRYDDAYQQAMNLMQHQVNMAQMSTDQQIEYLGRLKDAHAWTQQQMWSLEENINRLRKQQLSGYLSSFEAEQNATLDALDARTKKTITGLQEQLDALDADSTMSDREDARRSHNQKMADLQDQLHYYEQRVGKDAKNKVQELNQQIADEDYTWQKQQDEWVRDDKKKSLQDQIDDTQTAADEERDRLEKHYKEVVDLANQGALDTLAALAEKNPEWLEAGKNWIKNLMVGITQMEPEFQKTVQLATAQMGGYKAKLPETAMTPSVPGKGPGNPTAVIAPDQYTTVNGRPAMWSRELANLLGLSVDYDVATGTVNIGGKSFGALKEKDGRGYVSIRDVAEALGYTVDWEQSGMVSIYKAAKGGIFTTPSIAAVAEAGFPEAVLPLYKLQPMINDAVRYALINVQGSSQQTGDTVNIYFAEPVHVRSDQDIDNLTGRLTSEMFDKLQAARRGTGGRM